MAKRKEVVTKRSMAKQTNKQIVRQRIIKQSSIRSIKHKKIKSTNQQCTIYNIKFDKKNLLDIFNKTHNESEHINFIQALNDISIDVKEETKNINFLLNDTPEQTLHKVFSKLIDLYPNYELLLRYANSYYIEQVLYYDFLDFHIIPIEQMLMACEGNQSLISNFITCIKYLSDKYNIRYEINKDYLLEVKEDSYRHYKAENDIDSCKSVLKDIYEIRFGFLASVYNTIDCTNCFNKLYNDYDPNNLSERQKAVHDWIEFAFNNRLMDVYELEEHNENGETALSDMIRFVWSFQNDILDEVYEIEQQANNFGVIQPRFSNTITNISKEVVIPQNFKNLLKLFDYDRIKERIKPTKS